jgi:hypothetical protein
MFRGKLKKSHWETKCGPQVSIEEKLTTQWKAGKRKEN